MNETMARRTTAFRCGWTDARCAFGSALVLVLALFIVSPSHAQNVSVDLRVLVISTGTAAEDIGLDFIDDVLDEMDVPYDVLDSSRETLTAAGLSNGANVGFYNGIILTSTDLGVSGFTAAEWAILQDYERTFGVRESVLSGFPGVFHDLGLNYGMANFEGGISYSGQWVAPAGGTEFYEYINTTEPFPITDFAIASIPGADNSNPDNPAPTVTPLLENAGSFGGSFISLLTYTYADGTTREVLLSTIANAWFLIHSQALAYEFINFASSGVFLGGRQVHLTAHLDDLFIANDLWDPVNNVTDPEDLYRLSGQDIVDGVTQQNAFRAAHVTVGSDFKLDFPFNGSGAAIGEELTDAVVSNMNEFRFINHTHTHADMDTPHPELTECDYDTLTYNEIRLEISRNRTVWRNLALPDRGRNNRVLVTGNHSGLKDRNCTDFGDNAQADDIQYAAGANPDFLLAAQSRNVRYLASDSSQPNQAVEEYVAGYNLLLLPRYPTNVFFNVVTPLQLEDEYNYIFYERFINNGQDPCTIPGAICTPRDYDEILEAEADTAVRHMLTYRKWPHFFHQSNLGNYSEQPNTFATLQFDWLEAVATRYEEMFDLPIVNLPYWQIGDKTRDRLAARERVIQARWDKVRNRVSLQADQTVRRVLVTGLRGGTLYGGQRQRTITINPTPKNPRVDRALNL